MLGVSYWQATRICFRNVGVIAVLFVLALASYPQVQLLNFFFGPDVLLRPTSQQVESELESARERKPWPASGSVYSLDDTIVVVLTDVGSGGAPETTRPH